MNKTALEDLHFDTVVTAEYKLKMSAAASGSERGDRPVIFAEGGFDDGAAVTSTATEESAVGLTPLDSGLSQAYDDSTARLPWYERITVPISGGIIEQRHVSIPDDGQAAAAKRSRRAKRRKGSAMARRSMSRWKSRRTSGK